MTLDEKLEQFYNAAIDSATNQNIQMIDEFRKSLQDIFDEHKEDAIKKSNISFRLESENLVREKNRALSAESINIKRKISEKSAEIKNLLFADVHKKLIDYMKTPEYIELLTTEIKAAIEFSRGEAMTIYINSTDENLKANLEEKTGVQLTISTIDFMGGTRTVIHSKNILIDNSFLTKITEAKNVFML